MNLSPVHRSWLVENLRTDGLVELGMAPPKLIESIGSHLKKTDWYPGHVQAKGRQDPTNPARCCSMRSVMTIPGFFAYALSFAEVAWEYLEVGVPRLCSFNAFWTYPDMKLDRGLNEFHTDNEGRQMAMFVYGTDVLTDADGPHVLRGPNGDRKVYGRAGTVLLTDPSYPHKGLLPTSHPRLLLWARWDQHEHPSFYDKDELEPVPKDDVPGYPYDNPWLQKCCELVAR